MRFSHLAIRVKDINKMLKYYCNGLGFEEAFRIINDDDSLRIVYVHISEGQYLELCLGGDNRNEFDDKKTLGVRHMCFVVDDLVKSKKQLETRGVMFDSDIMQMKDKNMAAYLFDPEGNKIELVQTMQDSPHYKFEKTNLNK
jgi:catechol 2,3-dioxygenase-like lactoylglutathione lyase family enzyme